MLNKENYVPWSSRLLRYAKSRPNEKLIHNSIINGPYVRRMIPEPGDLNREVLVNKTFHVQTDDELTENELKQIEADDQAIQTILLVKVNGELFDVNVLEIGTWNTNITDTASDVSSQMEANHLDKDDTSVEDKENDELDDIDGIMKDLDNDAKNKENVFVSPKEVVKPT
nr:ribonuclease H-like domain-containing protein [Tanacetum cinerariifolium]